MKKSVYLFLFAVLIGSSHLEANSSWKMQNEFNYPNNSNAYKKPSYSTDGSVISSLPYDAILIPDPNDPSKPLLRTTAQSGLSNDAAITPYKQTSWRTPGEDPNVFRYESPVFGLPYAVDKLVITVTHTIYNDRPRDEGYNDGPYFNLTEFYLFDGDGEEITLSAGNFGSNAREPSEGSYEGLLDGDINTFFHSRWSSKNNETGYHTLEISMPEDLQKFSFAMEVIFNDTRISNMPTEIIVSRISRARIALQEIIEKADSYGIVLGGEPGFFSAEIISESFINALGNAKKVLSNELASDNELSNAATVLETAIIDIEKISMNLPKIGEIYQLSNQAPFVHHQGKVKNLTVLQNSVLWWADADPSDLYQDFVFESVETPVGAKDGDVFFAIKNTKTGKYIGRFINDEAWGNPWYIRLTDSPTPILVQGLGSGQIQLLSYNPTLGEWHGLHACNHNSGNATNQPGSQGGGKTAENWDGFSIQGVCGPIVQWETEAYGASSWYIRQHEELPITSLLEEGFEKVPHHLYQPIAIMTLTANNACSFNNLQITDILGSPINFNSKQCDENSIDIIFSQQVESFYFSFNNIEGVDSISITGGTYHKIEINGIFYSVYGKSAVVTYKEKKTNNSFIPYYYDSVNIPSTVNYKGKTYNVVEIGDDAFANSTGLMNVSIPKSVKKIGANSFASCSLLESIHLPEGIISIGDHAFYSCCSLKTVDIPKGLTRIENSCFENCSALTSIGIPDELNTIGEKAFFNCNSLTSICIPDSVKDIGFDAFDGCVCLPVDNNIRYADTYAVEAVDKEQTDYVIKEGTKWIGDDAFADCINITSFDIPESITHIGCNAFSGCNKLTSLTMGHSVETIGEWAFSQCVSLRTIFCPTKIPPILFSIHGNGFSDFKNFAIFVPAQSYDLYCNSVFWKDYTICTIPSNDEVCLTVNVRKPGTLPSEILRLGYQPSEISKLVILGDSINDTDWKVMLNQMPLLYDIELSELLIKVIPSSALAGKKNLQKIVLPNITETIGEKSFYNCSLYNQELTIPKNIKTIGNSAFYGTLLSDVNIGGVQTIENSAFSGCTFLSSVILPEGLVSIGDSVFYGSNLSDINLPSTLKSIGNSSFERLSITSLVLPDSLVYLGKNAFSGCYQIAGTIIIPDNLKSIEEGTFASCESLQKVILPNNLNSIQKQAFYNCSSLDTLEIPVTVDEIGWKAFAGCTSMKQITVHWEVPPMLEEANQFEGIDKKTCRLVVPQLTAGLYMTAPVWKEFVLLSENLEVEEHYLYELKEAIQEAEAWLAKFPDIAGEDDLRTAIHSGKNLFDLSGLFVNDVTDATERIQMALDVCNTNRMNDLNAIIQLIAEFMEKDSSGVSFEELNRLFAEAISTMEQEDFDVQEEAFNALQFEYHTLITLPEGKYVYSGSKPTLDYLSPYEVRLVADSLAKDAGTWETMVSATFSVDDSTLVKRLAYTYTIQPAPLRIAVVDTSRVYGEENPKFELAYEGFILDENEAVLITNPIIQTEARKDSDAGQYDVIVNGAEAKNYDISYTNGTLMIEKAPLTIVLVNASRIYGEENPEFELTYEGFVLDENETVFATKPAIQTEACKDSDVGQYDVIVSGAEAKNYDISYKNGMLMIEKAPQKIVWEQKLDEAMTGDTISLSAVSSSGLPVTYLLNNDDVVILFEKEGVWCLNCTGEGTVNIRATQEGDKNHLAADEIVKTLVVVINDIVNLRSDEAVEQYFRTNGMETEKMSKGIQVIVKRNADGSLSVRKVLVR